MAFALNKGLNKGIPIDSLIKCNRQEWREHSSVNLIQLAGLVPAGSDQFYRIRAVQGIRRLLFNHF